LVAEAVKAFGGSRSILESLDGFRYPVINRPSTASATIPSKQRTLLERKLELLSAGECVGENFFVGMFKNAASGNAACEARNLNREFR
jgi:hypothetical protein